MYTHKEEEDPRCRKSRCLCAKEQFNGRKISRHSSTEFFGTEEIGPIKKAVISGEWEEQLGTWWETLLSSPKVGRVAEWVGLCLEMTKNRGQRNMQFYKSSRSCTWVPALDAAWQIRSAPIGILGPWNILPPPSIFKYKNVAHKIIQTQH